MNLHGGAKTPLRSNAATGFSGTASVPGDKSISHRALLLGALAAGDTAITGLSAGGDVARTQAALGALGIAVIGAGDPHIAGGDVTVRGHGTGGLIAPGDVLDLGNSGTGARLLMGLLASHPFRSILTGDDSLRRRPMGRVAAPLAQMGAQISLAEDGCLPAVIDGSGSMFPARHEMAVPSAQVKSAILLAALNIPGETSIVERTPTRDHTERMLAAFGAEIAIATGPDGARTITLAGEPELRPVPVMIPADPSQAAFPGVAALIVPGAEVTIRDVCINPLRAGLFETLREMGADIRFENQREVAGEPLADLTFRASALKGVEVPAERAPSMIDEYPILAVAAAFADGVTHMHGIGELRIKESDRITAITDALRACGVTVEAGPDSLHVTGAPSGPQGGADGIATHMDHRIAMAMLVMGLGTKAPVGIDDGAMIDTSFPGFAQMMNGLGARIAPAEEMETQS